MRACLVRWSALLAVALAVAGSTSVRAVVGGDPDGKRHPFSGLIAYQIEPGGPWYVPPGGSANLVSSTVAVTAGHVLATPLTRVVLGIDPVQRGVVFDPVPIDLAAPFDLPGGFRKVPASIVHVAQSLTWHPDLVASPDNPKDIGVIVFEEPVTGVPPAHLPRPGLLDLMATMFGQIDMVGYGGTQFACCPPAGGGNRYSGSASIVDVTPNLLITGVIKDGDVSAFAGDSGGPALLEHNVLVGVMSSLAPNPDPTKPPFTRFYRTDSAAACEFLSQYLKTHCSVHPLP